MPYLSHLSIQQTVDFSLAPGMQNLFPDEGSKPGPAAVEACGEFRKQTPSFETLLSNRNEMGVSIKRTTSDGSYKMRSLNLWTTRQVLQ